MSWSTGKAPAGLVLLVVVLIAAVLVVQASRNREVWHPLDRGEGP